MKKMKKIVITFLCMITIALLGSKNVIATDIREIEIGRLEYTEEYQNWLNLSEEEKNKTLRPKMYEIQTEEEFNTSNNPLKLKRLLRSTNQSRYSLKEVIAENVKIKNQQDTNSCWAFAAIGVLETNLALQDNSYLETVPIYDFSERHMVYSCSRNAFFDNKINEKGFETEVSSGGNYLMAQAYLTNGSGAIDETQMSFENNEDKIDISSIQNKSIQTTLYDTAEFSYVTENDKEKLMQNMKSHISTYGGIYAGIYGADLTDEKFYRNETGALYVDDETVAMNHAVLIIGWDDTYDKNNFQEGHRPQNNGAWVIKNSWGEKEELTLEQAKREIYEGNEQEFADIGINQAQDIPDDVIVELYTEFGYVLDENRNMLSFKIGDNGLMYVSYEDAIIYDNLWGIKNAVNKKDYLNLYQNDVLGVSQIMTLNYHSGSVYIANAFNRDRNVTELLSKISIETYQNWNNCKVYVNPTGSDKAKENLQEMKLKEGNISENSINITPGYHTIELAEPIELTGNSFVVVLEFKADETPLIPLETVSEYGWQNAVVNENESFITVSENIDQNVWLDLTLLENEKLRGNVIIKALTEEKEVNNTNLTSLSITKQPNKTAYQIGENFDPAGMEVMAIYGNGTKKIITNYVIENGTNLQENQKDVVISYTENNITQKIVQPIIVTANGNENKTDKRPKASDFTNANAVITEMNLSSQNETVKMKITVSNIKIGDEDDEYTYSYCILDTTDKTQIKDDYWIEISNNQVQKQSNGTYTIWLDIDLNKMKNLNALMNADTIYLYLKETAKINHQEIQTIHALDIQFDTNSETKTEQVGEQTPNFTTPVKSNDDTVANKILPKTGKIRIVLIIICLIGIGSVCYLKYKNIDK